jgi:hypothetical protein
MSVPRLGHVDIPVQVHFPLDSKRSVVTLETKRFEVLQMSHDFIIGVEFLRILFPSDELLSFAGPHSSITDSPSEQVASLLASCSTVAHVCDECGDDDDPRVAATSPPSPSSSSSASPSHSQ